ncbi:9536_t:CDS:1, partial [Gigaspora margarita]
GSTHRNVLRNGKVKMAWLLRQRVARNITLYEIAHSDAMYVCVTDVMCWLVIHIGSFVESE